MDSGCNSSYQNAEAIMEVEGEEGQSGNLQKEVLSLLLMERGLHTIGLNPNTLQFSFIGLDISGESLQNIDYIQKYPNLMNINLANNEVESLKALSALPMLTTLNARANHLSSCLDFAPLHCAKENAWSSGQLAVGSMLTAADLSENHIILMQDLTHHPYLECLNVSRNLIEEIGGLASLRFLRVLNLSYNRLSKLSNLEGVTTITDLNVEGNAIESLDGLNTLSRLRSLNLSHNRIQDLEPLSTMTSLQTISLSGNQLHDFRQLKHLKPLANLTSLDLDGNAFSADRFYRLRCMFSLPQLLSLDKTNASPEEKLQAQNLYRTEAGELGLRRAAHMEYLPSEPFIDYSSQYLSAE